MLLLYLEKNQLVENSAEVSLKIKQASQISMIKLEIYLSRSAGLPQATPSRHAAAFLIVYTIAHTKAVLRCKIKFSGVVLQEPQFCLLSR